MTMFLAIMLTFVITLVVGFIGTTFFIVWLMSENKDYRDFWRKTIKDFSDEEEYESDSN